MTYNKGPETVEQGAKFIRSAPNGTAILEPIGTLGTSWGNRFSSDKAQSFQKLLQGPQMCAGCSLRAKQVASELGPEIEQATAPTGSGPARAKCTAIKIHA